MRKKPLQSFKLWLFKRKGLKQEKKESNHLKKVERGRGTRKKKTGQGEEDEAEEFVSDWAFVIMEKTMMHK